MKLTFFGAMAALLSTIFLQGCAGAVVGGAAAGGLTAHDQRSVGVVVDDESIELQAQTEYFKSAKLRDNAHLNFTSYNGLLLITGEAPTQELKSLATSVVRDIDKVRRVQNEVVIASPSTMLLRSSDTYLTAKVKTSLVRVDGMPDFDPTRVKIVSENGTVFLMGLLSRSEGDAITNHTRQIGGVQRVVKVFEYVQ